MEYRCRARNLFRATGLAAGIIVCTGAAFAADDEGINLENVRRQHQVTKLPLTGPEGARPVGQNQIQTNGRTNGNISISPVCNVTGQNCQDRERINGPAYRIVLGDFNARAEKRIDEIRFAADAHLKEVCLRWEYLDPGVCHGLINVANDPDCGCVVAVPPDPVTCDPALADAVCDQIIDPGAKDANLFGLLQITILDDLFGVPDVLPAGIAVAGPYRGDFGSVPPAADQNTGAAIVDTLTVTQQPTGDSIGFLTPTFTEMGVRADFPITNQPFIPGNTCKWIEFDWENNGGPCAMLMVASPEAGPGEGGAGAGGTGGPGNMRSLTYDSSNRLTLIPFQDFRQFDLHYCALAEDTAGAVGSGLAVNLANTNGAGSCTNLVAPGNDDINSAQSVLCGAAAIAFDNRFATFDSTFPEGQCRGNVVEDVPSSAGDVWFQVVASVADPLNPGTASIIMGLCDTNTLDGQSGGNSLLQLYAFVGGSPPVGAITPADIFEIGCNNNGCGTLSQLCATNLVLGDTYLIRVHSFSYQGVGSYSFKIDCPCPFIVNDTCDTAIVVPLGDGVNPGFTNVAGINMIGDTSAGNVEPEPTGCETAARIDPSNGPAAMTSNSAWFSLPGQGALISLDTNITVPGVSAMDTHVSVWCSVDNTCNNLTCIGGNEDIDGQVANFASQMTFCGINGKTYYISMRGFGTSSGQFAMNVRQLRDSTPGQNPILCGANGNECVVQASFQIPPDSLNEVTDLGALSENCTGVEDGSATVPPLQPKPDINGNNNGCAGPPDAPGGTTFINKYIPIIEGQAVTGSLYSLNGGRDQDYFVFEGMNPNANNAPIGPTIVDLSLQSERAVVQRPFAVFSSIIDCGILGVVSWNNLLDYNGERADFKSWYDDENGVDRFGVPTGAPGHLGSMVFRLRQRVTGQGTPCGVLDRYWFRVNDAVSMDLCTAVADPAGVSSTDNLANPLQGEVTLGDFDNERFVPTFGTPANPGFGTDFTAEVDPTFGFAIGTSGTGAAGASVGLDPSQGAGVCGAEGDVHDVFAGEVCEIRRNLGCTTGQQLEGCNVSGPNVDGDFAWLRPNVPIVGQMNGVVGFSGVERDIDQYKFRIGNAADVAAGRQFLVTIEVDAAVPTNFTIAEARCGPTILDQIGYATAATLGDCGARRLKANGSSILTAGVYVVTGGWGDIFGPGNGVIFSALPCSFTGDPLNDPGASKYVLRVNASPLTANAFAPLAGAVTKTAEAFEGCPIGVDPLPADLNSHLPGQGNDGCAVGSFNADSIASGDVVQGQLFSQVDTSDNNPTWTIDQDYYSFSVATAASVTISGRADGPVVLSVNHVGPGGSLCIADNPGSEGTFSTPRGGVRSIDSFDLAANGNGAPNSRTVFLTPGTYAIAAFPGTVADGIAAQDLNCTTNSQLSYSFDVVMTTGLASLAAGNPLFTVGAAGSGGAYASISGTGTAVNFTEDNGNLVSPLLPAGWEFSLGCGTPFSTLGVSDNGYISFGNAADPRAQTGTARAFPDSGAPNSIIAPLFHDWTPLLGGADPDGVIFFEATGTDFTKGGDGVTTVSWENVRRNRNAAHSASFQVVLNHADGSIEFRYGPMADADAGSSTPNSLAAATGSGAFFSAGVEDDTGLNGIGVDLGLIPALGGNTSVKLTAFTCLGDGNGNCVIDFGDITAVLGKFNQPASACPACDADGNGTIAFGDITTILGNFGNPCP